ncbi:hypothetical protein NKH47_12220 [Mesorhizobium sp. M1060]|uniref:hypothetical protein n=1 Tax=Mesorhizobium sp. M1060 TaxID=2957052 RepID=UPI00333DA774
MNQKLWSFLACALFAASPGLAHAECLAPDEWFAGATVPEPLNTEPQRGEECDFYQRAWQHFLYATQGDFDNPAFISYPSYTDVFGEDRKAGLFVSVDIKAHAGPHIMSLAPRLMKSEQANNAEDILQAGSNQLLIDQNGHPIFYNIFMNKAFANLIETKKYNTAELQKADPKEELPPGVVEFKAAWQIVDEKSPPTDRIVVVANVPWLIADPKNPGKLIVDDTRKLRQVSVALIGLHVVFVTDEHPEMIWATFEYDRNAPSSAGNPTAVDASYCQNSEEPKDDTIVADDQPYMLYQTGAQGSDVNQKPQSITVTDDAMQVFAVAPKTSIARAFPFSSCAPGFNPNIAVTGLDEDVFDLNKSVRSKNKKPWLSSYSMVGTVWMDEPRNPNEGLAFEEGQALDYFQLRGENRLSSVSMESFTQTSSSNCFSCHDTNSKGKLGPMRISVSHMFRRFSLTLPDQ